MMGLYDDGRRKARASEEPFHTCTVCGHPTMSNYSLPCTPISFLIYSRTSCANRAKPATVWSTGDTCSVCGHPTMSNYFTIYFYKILGVAVLAFTYCSGYHCYSYYLSNYKLGVHMYCLWPPHYNTLGVHMYCLWQCTTTNWVLLH